MIAMETQRGTQRSVARNSKNKSARRDKHKGKEDIEIADGDRSSKRADRLRPPRARSASAILCLRCDRHSLALRLRRMYLGRRHGLDGLKDLQRKGSREYGSGCLDDPCSHVKLAGLFLDAAIQTSLSSQ